MKTISLVIPSNKKLSQFSERLSRTLANVDQSHLQQVFIVFNGTGEDDLASHQKSQLAGPVEIKTCQGGLNGARNSGLKLVSSDIALLIDDDCLITDVDYLNRLLQYHREYPEAIAIGGIYGLPEKVQPLAMAYHLMGRYWQLSSWQPDLNSTHLVGGNLSIKVNRLKEIDQWFDDSIAFGGTELEYVNRLKACGQKTLLLQSLEVLHEHELTLSSYQKKINHQKVFQKSSSLTTNHRLFADYDLALTEALKLSPDPKYFSEVVRYLDIYKETFDAP